ncbi:MAG TPA: hypothetical protein VN704_07895 [Verrucomicrobiae bacterium]|nr:hypothetical protein [Verrucomicrobiae bacterium]
MNWPTYNQSLVRRGEILLGFDIKNWDRSKRDEPRQGWIRSHFIILTLFFFYLIMRKYIFIYHTDKPKKK